MVCRGSEVNMQCFLPVGYGIFFFLRKFFLFLVSSGMECSTFEEKSTMNNFHFCISGGDEILFRSEIDYIRGFNTLALSVAETGSLLSAEAFMSTHLHVCVRTDDVNALIYRFWRSYTRYFNSKYKRKGTLGERPFVLEIDGFHHWLTAICYVMRNPVHHGVSPTPFAYRHCSANALFRMETGKFRTSAGTLPRRSFYRYLPKGSDCPACFEMDDTGMILRETVLDLADVEYRFATPRAFLFYMNRLTGEEWKREQDKDATGSAPITLEMIERQARTETLSEMLRHEHGRSDYKAVSDMELCEKIDGELLPISGKDSVYELSVQDKQQLLKHLRSDSRVPEKQVKRCLVMK